jgi:hypothetical protein
MTYLGMIGSDDLCHECRSHKIDYKVVIQPVDRSDLLIDKSYCTWCIFNDDMACCEACLTRTRDIMFIGNFKNEYCVYRKCKDCQENESSMREQHYASPDHDADGECWCRDHLFVRDRLGRTMKDIAPPGR